MSRQPRLVSVVAALVATVVVAPASAAAAVAPDPAAEESMGTPSRADSAAVLDEEPSSGPLKRSAIEARRVALVAAQGGDRGDPPPVPPVDEPAPDVSVGDALVEAAPFEPPVAAGDVAGIDEPPVDEEVLEPVGPGAPQGAVAEVVSRRSSNVKVFTTDEGQRIGQVFATPVHVKDENGRLVDIDLRLARRGDRVAPARAAAAVSFGGRGASGRAEPLVSVDTAAGVLGWDLVGAADVEPTIGGEEDTVATYPEILPGVDLRLSPLLQGGMKDDIVLAGPDSQRSFDFELRLPPGTAASVTELGDVEVATAGTGEVVGVLSRGFMVDSSAHPETGEPAISDGVRYELSGQGRQPTLRMTLDDGWLDAPGRVWPVTVDPATVTAIVQSDDTWIRQGYTSNYSTLSRLEVGNSGYGAQRALLHFNMAGFANQQIQSARLMVRIYHSPSCTNRQVKAYRIRDAWSGSSVTWANRPSTGNYMGAKSFANCPSGYYTVPLNAGYVQQWADDAWANHGMMLIAGNESITDAWKKLFSANASYGKRPYLEVTFDAPTVPTGLRTSPTSTIHHPAPPTMSAVYHHEAGYPSPGWLHFTLERRQSGSWNYHSQRWVTVNDGQRGSWRPSSLPVGRYRWRVHGETDYADSANSSFKEFYVHRRPTTPTLVAPSSGSEHTGVPRMEVRSTDADGDKVKVRFQVFEATSGTKVADSTGPLRSSGATHPFRPSTLSTGYDYYRWRAHAQDEHGTNSANPTWGGWWYYHVVPAVPTVVAPAALRNYDTTPTLQARANGGLADADQFLEFRLQKRDSAFGDGWTQVQTQEVPTNTGDVGSWTPTTLPPGDYRFDVRGMGAHRHSAWTEWTHFAVDAPTGEGLRDGWDYDTFRVTDQLTVHVNRGNGNPVVTMTDGSTPGIAGHDQTSTLVYNGRYLHDGPHGPGWRSTLTEPGTIASSGTTATVTDPTGWTVDYTDDGTGTYVAQGRSRADLTPDGTGWALTRHADQSVRRFDTAGRLSAHEDRSGNTIAYGRDATTGRLETITDTRGRDTTVDWSGGRITGLTGPASTGYGYDGQGRLATVTDANGDTYTFGYDSLDRLTTITDPESNMFDILYEASGLPGRVDEIYHDGYQTDYDYHADCSLDTRFPAGSLGPGACSVRQRHTGQLDATYVPDTDTGWVGNRTDGAGTTWTVARDQPTGNTPSVTAPTGEATTTTYNTAAAGGPADDSGRFDPTGTTTTDGTTSTTTSTAYGDPNWVHQPTQVTDAAGTTTTMSYNPPGTVGAGRLDTVTDPSGRTTSTTWTSAGQLASRVDAGTGGTQATTTYTYSTDGNQHLQTVTEPGAGTVDYSNYDATSRPGTVVDGNTVESTMTYDGMGRVTSRSFPTDPTQDQTFTYDRAGNRVSWSTDGGVTTGTRTFDARNLLATETMPGTTATTTFQLDRAQSQMTSTRGEGVIVTGRNSRGQPTGIGPVAGSATPAASFDYDDAGRLTEILWASDGTRQTYDYDGLGRLTGVALTDSTGTQVAARAYGYDAPTATPAIGEQGRILWQSDPIAGWTERYGYDPVGRLTHVYDSLDGTANQTLRYVYDDRGNRTAVEVNGTVDPALSATFPDPGSRPATLGGQTVGHNGAGSWTSIGTTRTFAHDLSNRLTATGGSSSSTYTYGTPTAATRTSIGGTAQAQTSLGVEGEQSTSGFVDDIRIPDGGRLLARVRPDGTVHRLHDDGRGNIIAVTDQTGAVVAGYRYTPYGRDAGSTGSIDNPYRFQGTSGGHTEDGTGLIHLAHRSYDPTYGMFTSRDPIHSPTNRTQQNPYLYAGGDPINLSDPTGLFSWSSALDTVSTVAAGVGIAAGVVGAVASAPAVVAGAATVAAYAGATSTLTGAGAEASRGCWSGAAQELAIGAVGAGTVGSALSGAARGSTQLARAANGTGAVVDAVGAGASAASGSSC